MITRQSQESFEEKMRAQLEANAYVKKLEAAADFYLKQIYQGIEVFCHPMVPREVVARFGTSDKAFRCVDYVLQQVVSSGVVSDVYTPAMATADAWRLIDLALKSGVNFDFAQEPHTGFKAAFVKLVVVNK